MASKVKFVPDGNAPFMKCPEHLFPLVGASNPGKKRKEFFCPYFCTKRSFFLTFLTERMKRGWLKTK
jgi:hypothetical protein